MRATVDYRKISWATAHISLKFSSEFMREKVQTGSLKSLFDFILSQRDASCLDQANQHQNTEFR